MPYFTVNDSSDSVGHHALVKRKHGKTGKQSCRYGKENDETS
jgi:hypothetical protein